MGGPAKEDKSAERQIASEQTALGREMVNMAKGELAQRRTDEQPLRDLYAKLIGGDRNTALQVAAPGISEMTKSAALSRENAFDSVPAGAGRDYALAMGDMNKNSQVASFVNNVWNQAFTGLANLGKESGQMGLQQTGAGLNSYQGASQNLNNVMQADASSKASTMGFLGSLAGAAGTAASGGMKPSDRRLKRDIEEVSGVLDKLDDIGVVRYKLVGEDAPEIGVIAQEVEPHFPEVVARPDDSNPYYRVDYSGLAAVALQAVKELREQVTGQARRIEQLEEMLMAVGKEG